MVQSRLLLVSHGQDGDCTKSRARLCRQRELPSYQFHKHDAAALPTTMRAMLKALNRRLPA